MQLEKGRPHIGGDMCELVAKVDRQTVFFSVCVLVWVGELVCVCVCERKRICEHVM